MLSGELDHGNPLKSQVWSTAFRRVILGEDVPNSEKLFILFEPHTQLYRRGKAKEPNQFSRLFLVFEDEAGFMSYYHLMDRDAATPSWSSSRRGPAQQKHDGLI